MAASSGACSLAVLPRQVKLPPAGTVHSIRALVALPMSASHSPVQRSFTDRLRQIALFEIGGLLLITPPYIWLSGQPGRDSFVLMAILAVIAAIWNGSFNTAFDWLEGRLTGRTADRRPWQLRAVHAVGFEGGLFMITLPVVMLWTGMDWLTALVADISIALAYVVYAFGFNLAYDRAFPIVADAGR